MNRYAQLEDDDLLSLIRQGNEDAFMEVWQRYNEKLLQYAYRTVRSKEQSEDMVQEIFIDLWKRHETVNPYGASLDGFLFRAVKNKVLNYMRSESVSKRYAEHYTLFLATRTDNSNEETQDVNALQETIDKHISGLPDNQQVAFRLSRYEHVSIREIAKRMNVSTRTVEGYLTKVLKHLRISLGEFMVLVWWLVGM